MLIVVIASLPSNSRFSSAVRSCRPLRRRAVSDIPDRAQQPIVKQLINGTGSVPGIPIVWGISATVKRFNDAMTGMTGRSTLPNVEVDSKKVQDSGLIKDTIKLDIPDEAGDVTTVLLRRGTERLRAMAKAWADYNADQGQGETVVPLMVLQVPNNPDPNEIGRWLDTVFETWPELPDDCVANVLGEHRTEQFGSYAVPYVEPERVKTKLRRSSKRKRTSLLWALSVQSNCGWSRRRKTWPIDG